MGKRKQRPLLTYVLDNREQREYAMAVPDPQLFDDGGWYFDTLPEGDITAEINCERIDIIIERKQLLDFINCCARDRERFENEMARLAAYAHVHILIEAPFAQIRAGSPRSQVSGLAVVNSIAHWATVYPSIHWWPVTNRIEGQVWARTLIHEAAKHHVSRIDLS